MSTNQPQAPRPSPDHPAGSALPGGPAGPPVPRNRPWLPRALMSFGLGLVVLGAAACDPPGNTVRAFVRDGELVVVGTNEPDAIVLRLELGNSDVLHVDVGADGTADFDFDRDDFSQITVRGWGGNDLLALDESNRSFTDVEQVQLLGGDGDDILLGASGGEYLQGDAGNDTIDGGPGGDTIHAGPGDDTVTWDPGDGTGMIAGAEGRDRLVVTGSDGADAIEVESTSGDRILVDVFAHDQIWINGIEDVTIRPLGGADVVRVGAVPDGGHTDITDITVDLAGPTGADAMLDRVVVPRGVHLGRDGSVATIGGRGHQIRVAGGTPTDHIEVLGTTGHDTQQLTGTDGSEVVSVTALATDVAVNGLTGPVPVHLLAIEELYVDLAGGNDFFGTTGNLAAHMTLAVNGGAGNDTIVGSNGLDVLSGGAGDDWLDGQAGNDLLDGGAGDDQFDWKPGDGSDDLRGGTGTDRLLFDGGNVDEIFDIRNEGGKARALRNVGNIVHTLDAVEVVEVRPFGGADDVRVQDLTGTGVTTVLADLAAQLGGDDGAQDRIHVPLGVTLGSDGPVGVVGGLGAQVRVANGTTADQIFIQGTAALDDVQRITGTNGPDTMSVFANGPDVSVHGATGSVMTDLNGVENLDIDLLGGADTFSATGNLAALTNLDVDGGPGADTLSGSNGPDVLRGGPGADFIDGQQGIDEVDGGDGNDTFQWDPGDGLGGVEGGAGNDRLVFNGASANENYTVRGSGGNVIVDRDVASVTFFAHGVEVLDLNTLSGTDKVSFFDMEGTHLTTVNVDVAAFGGGDDGATDRLTVDAGVTLGYDGAAPTIDGLGARIRLVHPGVGDHIEVFGTQAADVQRFVGTNGPDTVSVSANTPNVAVTGFTGPVYVDLVAVERIDIDLLGGDDTFGSAGNVAALAALDIDGGAGNDTLVGGNGADIIYGGAGNDFIDGQMGDDFISGGPDDDTFQWDPGDNNDLVFGAGGIDNVQFNGSPTAESFHLAAFAGRARLTRDVGSVTLDMDDVESLELHTLAGADIVVIGDLSSTDLDKVDVDLAGTLFGADPDGVVDGVTVQGTNGPDAIHVSDDGPAVVVSGLSTTVRVHSADTNDHLVANGLLGADTVTATEAAHALMTLFLVP